jgi:hypothetical protein
MIGEDAVEVSGLNRGRPPLDQRANFLFNRTHVSTR